MLLRIIFNYTLSSHRTKYPYTQCFYHFLVFVFKRLQSLSKILQFCRMIYKYFWVQAYSVTSNIYQLLHICSCWIITHSSVLAWRIPGTGEPGGLLFMELHRVGHDWSDLAAAAAAEVIITKCDWARKIKEEPGTCWARHNRHTKLEKL